MKNQTQFRKKTKDPIQTDREKERERERGNYGRRCRRREGIYRYMYRWGRLGAFDIGRE